MMGGRLGGKLHDTIALYCRSCTDEPRSSRELYSVTPTRCLPDSTQYGRIESRLYYDEPRTPSLTERTPRTKDWPTTRSEDCMN